MVAKKSIPKELEGAGSIVEDFETRITSLEERFGDNEKIARTIGEVSDNIKNFDKVFEKAILDFLRSNIDVKAEVKKIIDETDRNTANELLKKFGKTLGWIISLIITAVVTWYLSKPR
jgi:hypothetical protein